MKGSEDCSDEVGVLDVLVFLATNVRLLILIPLIISGTAYVAAGLSEEEHIAFYNLQFPSSVHPYIVDPIVMAAYTDDNAVKTTLVDNGIRWYFQARSEQDAVDAISAARDAALDAVSNLVAADISAEAGSYLGLSEAGVAKQISTIRRWAEIVRREPVAVSSTAKGGIWIAAVSALSFIFTLCFLAIREAIRSAKMTPEGAAKLGRIKASLLGQKL